MHTLLYALLVVSSLDSVIPEEKPPIELPADFPKEAVICQDILVTEEAVCTKRLPIRDALTLIDSMTLDWTLGLSGQAYLSKPYIVTNFDPLFPVLSRQKPPF